MTDWTEGEIRSVAVDSIGERYRRYRLENWLRHRGRADLAPCDRTVLSPSFARLTRDARTVAELTEDLLTEIDLP